MSFVLRTVVFITLNFTKIVEVIGIIEFGLTAAVVSLDLISEAAQFTVHRRGSVFTGTIGADGEAEARRYLTDAGFEVKDSVQSSNGQGVDIIAKSAKGDWCRFEVKTTTSGAPVTIPLQLSEQQQDMEGFNDCLWL
jgi:hypothetical protein